MRSLTASLSFVGALVFLAAFAPSCGDDDDDPPATGSTGGSGGGGSGPVSCGGKVCEPLMVPGAAPVRACCDSVTNRCGLDTSLLTLLGAQPTRACEPLSQPGKADSACPDVQNVQVPGAGLAVSFQGCCRTETQKCGYLVDRVSIVSVGLGCVDSTPFLMGGTPLPCGS